MDNPNPHLRAYLEGFLATPDPGFALLLSAPWGAGKTHAIKAFMVKRDHIYVSLFGVRSREDIDSAILLARLTRSDQQAVKMLASLGLTAMKTFGLPVKPEDLARIRLPQTLVIDDLERAEMPMRELLGSLNGIVENLGKNLILLGNEDELRKDEDYLSQKEKLIGRTLTYNPDFEQAFQHFLDQIEDQAAQEALKKNSERLKRVFTISGFKNLRILRQALHEFSKLHAALDEEMQCKEQAVSDLLATFVALYMDYASGSLSREDLSGREEWRNLAGPGRKDHPLTFSQEKYAPADIAVTPGNVLPVRLGVSLIVDGYASPEFIRTALQGTLGFSSPTNEAAWKTLWWWSRRPPSSVEIALGKVQQAIESNELYVPGVLMEVFGVFLALSDAAVLPLSREQVVSDAIKAIDRLSDAALLPAFDPRAHYGFSLDIDSYDGLGFQQRETHEFRKIVDHLKFMQRRRYEDSYLSIAENLFELIPTDMDTVLHALTDSGSDQISPSYVDTPILLQTDPAKVASLFVDQSIETTELLFKALGERVIHQERHQVSDGVRETEKDWLKKFRGEVEEIAESSAPIRRAQLRRYLKWHLSEALSGDASDQTG